MRTLAFVGLLMMGACASAPPKVTVERMPQVHRPDWLQKVPDQLLAIDECVEDLPQPAFVVHLQHIDRRTGVATIDGKGRTGLCVWTEEQGVVLREPSSLEAEEVNKHPLVSLGRVKPEGPAWAVVEPVRDGGEVVAWVQWRDMP